MQAVVEGVPAEAVAPEPAEAAATEEFDDNMQEAREWIAAWRIKQAERVQQAAEPVAPEPAAVEAAIEAPVAAPAAGAAGLSQQEAEEARQGAAKDQSDAALEALEASVAGQATTAAAPAPAEVEAAAAVAAPAPAEAEAVVAGDGAPAEREEMLRGNLVAGFTVTQVRRRQGKLVRSLSSQQEGWPCLLLPERGHELPCWMHLLGIQISMCACSKTSPCCCLPACLSQEPAAPGPSTARPGAGAAERAGAQGAGPLGVLRLLEGVKEAGRLLCSLAQQLTGGANDK